MKTRVVSESHAGVTTEGEYRQLSWGEWELVRWRMTVDGKAGEWHKVHGNRRKAVGSLDLLISDEQMEIKTARTKQGG